MRSILSSVVLLFFCQGAWAQSCFSVPVENPFSGDPESEVWCQDLSDPQLQIYWRQDSSQTVSDEDIVIRLQDQSWIHSSLVKGQHQIVRTTDLDLVPMNIKDQLVRLETFPRVQQRTIALARARSLRIIQSARWVRTRQISEGTFAAKLSEDRMPFGGYWWPYKLQELSSGDQSPLGKFDRWHQAHYQKASGAKQWESANHNLQQVSWGGHCNGWAASAILYPEPTVAVADPVSKIVFLASDLKGILASTSFCVNWAFYGKRYRQVGDDPKDISPDRFHKLLEHYILKLNKPIAFDYFPDDQVDNNIITGYELRISKTGPNLFQVSASIQAAEYHLDRDETAGVATPRSFHYSYQLTTNDAGEIVSGQWTSASNPDFLWVPVSQANCGRENPQVDYRKVNQILQLPPAQKQSLTLNREIEIQLAPSQQQRILEDVQWPEGPGGELSYEVPADVQVNSLYLSGQEESLYPSVYGTVDSFGRYMDPNSKAFTFDGIRPRQISITNYGSKPVRFKMKFLNYHWNGIQ